jgi:UDPglucose 6-dehydrogenase
MKIGIIGLGSVGSAAFKTLKDFFPTVGYDIDGRGEWKDILDTDAVMVCVPTDASENGNLDVSSVFVTAEKLSKFRYHGLIIVKSTIQPRTMDFLEESFPNLRLAYVPEFLREKDADEWFRNPDRLVYSCDDLDEKVLLSCFQWISSEMPRIRMTHLEAEFGKLAHNAFIASKVTFTCEIERICNINSIDARNVMEAVWRDRRINNPAHLTPYLGGFRGKCVPKDTQALVNEDPDEDSILHKIEKRGSYENVKKRMY